MQKKKREIKKKKKTKRGVGWGGLDCQRGIELQCCVEYVRGDGWMIWCLRV